MNLKSWENSTFPSFEFQADLTYNLKAVWDTQYAMLLSNYKWDDSIVPLSKQSYQTGVLSTLAECYFGDSLGL